MCIPLAEEFFCSDKLTLSVSHIATVWHILQGAVVGTQIHRVASVNVTVLVFSFLLREGGLFF